MATENGKTIEVSSQDAIGDAPIQGFATKDGEVVSRGGKAVEPSKPAAAPVAKAKAPADDDQGGDQGNADENRHRSAQARIDRAVGRQREAERERDSLRAQNQGLESRLASIEARLNGGGQQQQRQAPADGAPDVTKYEYGELDARYIRDLARYEARQEFAAQQENVQKQSTSAAQQRANEAFIEKANTFRDAGLDKYDDFEELVLDNALPITPILAELFFESEHGVDIAYALALDPKEAKRVSALPPARQAAWFGRKEAELSSGSTDADDDEPVQQSGASRKTTQAPPPPKTRTRGSGGQQQVSGATSDFAAFERMATKQQ